MCWEFTNPLPGRDVPRSNLTRGRKIVLMRIAEENEADFEERWHEAIIR
jgi:hypothetical protein